MARALIAGCGCRGRSLGAELAASGWMVRGTSRTQAGAKAIEAAGLEGVVVDPDRIADVMEHVADVTVLVWLMGSAAGSRESVEALHTARLERLLEELVDTPVRGFVYEAAGSAPPAALASGRRAVEAAAATWRIPARIVEADPGGHEAWLAAMSAAVASLIS